MSQPPRRPTAFKLTDSPQATPTAAKPQQSAKRAPRKLAAPEAVIEDDIPAATTLPVREAATSLSRGLRWGGILFAALGAIIMLLTGLLVVQFIEDLFARHVIFGWIGLGLGALVGLSLLALILRELRAISRLRALGQIQSDAIQAISQDDAEAANRVTRSLKKIYRGRSDLRWGLQRLQEDEREIIDPGDRIRLIERDVMASLDSEASRIIARTARRVAVITAVLPAAALDILLVGAQNLRMLHDLFRLYGGKPGHTGALRLGRMVLSHLALTGGLALTDTLVQGLIGKGLAGRLSSRLGEGTVNGILTARIGLAAMEVIRPVPFAHAPKPSLSDFIKEILSTDKPAPKP